MVVARTSKPKHAVLVSCAVLLALGACTNTKHTPVGTPGDPAALAAEKARADALAEALADLSAAQAALGAAGGADGQRMAARQAVAAARTSLGEVRTGLTELPASAARTTAVGAVDAVKEALDAVAAALGAVAAVTASGAGAAAPDPADAHTGLDRARSALSAAQTSLTEALAADLTPEIMTLLLQAQATLNTASSSLLSALYAELDALAPYDARASLADALLPRGERFVPRGEARSIARTPRTDSGEAGWTKLDIETDAAAYAAGKRVGAATGGLAATDELPLRAITLRAAGRHPMKIQGDDGTPAAYGNTDGVVESSLRIGDGGVTLKFGGEGLVYFDMQRQFDYHNRPDGTAPNHNAWWRYGPDGKLGDAGAAAGGTITASHARDLGLSAAGGTLSAAQATALQGYATDNAGACWRDPLSDCGDWAHDDLTIAFGAPAQSPQGEAAYYWKIRAPFTRLQRDTGLPAENNDGRPQDLGTYELWLSHYGGVDDKGTDAEGDDTQRYLEYAAYGLFTFLDGVVQTPSFLRPHAFAFGYDAFRDADGMKTTDVTTSIAATFEGHTMARQLTTDGSTTHVVVTGADVLRGDVTLNACIGGSGCSGTGIPTDANKVSGLISGLEELRHDGVWVPVRYGNIPMVEGDVAADGSFAGALDYPREDATDPGTQNSWEYNSGAPGEGGESQYGGNFYGPRDGLEAAGWWYVQPDPRLKDDTGTNIGGIVGSFGAKCASGCD